MAMPYSDIFSQVFCNCSKGIFLIIFSVTLLWKYLRTEEEQQIKICLILSYPLTTYSQVL